MVPQRYFYYTELRKIRQSPFSLTAVACHGVFLPNQGTLGTITRIELLASFPLYLNREKGNNNWE
jgi:hypothetical protein